MTKQTLNQLPQNNPVIKPDSPNNSRFITEKSFPYLKNVLRQAQEKKKAVWKKLLRFVTTYKSLFVGIGFFLLSLAIGIQGVMLYTHWQEKQAIDQARQTLLSEKAYWEKIVQTYKGYRDGYFQLAIVEYRLDNKEKAKKYLQEVFVLDPNFEEGRKLELLLKDR